MQKNYEPDVKTKCYHSDPRKGKAMIKCSDPELYQENKDYAKELNPYNIMFNWNTTDPWLGTFPEFGYIDIEGEPGNAGFYWLWPCDNPDAPILVTQIGGPGMGVLLKAFGRFNPLEVDGKNRCFKVNPDPLTKKVNLLYIESPIGSGYSTANIPTKNHDHDMEQQEKFFKVLLEKNPTWQSKTWYWNGESYAGTSIPSNATNLMKKFN